MSAPDILFKGIPRGNTRGYTANCIVAFDPEVIVIPCVGSFALAGVARACGIKSSSIVAGDISLYSTSIGRAIMAEDWRLDLTDAGRELCPDLDKHLTDPISKAATVLFMIRYLQHEKTNKTIYHKDLQRELMFNRETYLLQIKEQVAELREAYKGMTYKAQDMWVTLDEYKSNPKAMLLVNPPRYDGGYDRMFKGIDDVFAWDQPNAEMFKEKDYARLMDLLGSEPAYTLMYYATQGEDPAPTWGEPWRSTFADRPGNKRVAAINWIIANKSPTGHMATRAKLEQGAGKYRMFDGEITEKSLLVAAPIERAVGDYYRDLFIHKLPGSVTEKYVGLFLDGCLFAVVGLHMADLRMGSKKKGTMGRGSITFAFTVPHDTITRLHKLTLLSAVSSWFWDDVMGREKGYEIFSQPLTVHTTMLTNHPENKTARGILKLIDRVQQKDGSYKLSYSAQIEKRSRKETLDLWQSRFNRKA